MQDENLLDAGAGLIGQSIASECLTVALLIGLVRHGILPSDAAKDIINKTLATATEMLSSNKEASAEWTAKAIAAATESMHNILEHPVITGS